jgi:hypothetical protein
MSQDMQHLLLTSSAADGNSLSALLCSSAM